MRLQKISSTNPPEPKKNSVADTTKGSIGNKYTELELKALFFGEKSDICETVSAPNFTLGDFWLKLSMNEHFVPIAKYRGKPPNS
jgi:hypothetical protein